MHCRLDASLFEDSKAYSADESLQMFVLRWTEICRDLQKKSICLWSKYLNLNPKYLLFYQLNN